MSRENGQGVSVAQQSFEGAPHIGDRPIKASSQAMNWIDLVWILARPAPAVAYATKASQAVSAGRSAPSEPSPLPLVENDAHDDCWHL